MVSKNGATGVVNDRTKIKTIVVTLVMISSYGTTGVMNDRVKIKTIVATPVIVQLE